jgi:hypothetical protein
LGSVRDTLMFAMTLQWENAPASSERPIRQEVHIRLQVYVLAIGRRIRLLNFHLPEWQQQKCLKCGQGYHEYQIIVSRTSLQEPSSRI